MKSADAGILEPLAWLAAPVLVVAVIVLIFRSNERIRRAAACGVALQASRIASLCWPILPLLLLGLALLRPYWDSEQHEVTVPGDDYMFLVDVSRSMYTRDVAPSRIELAKRKLKDLVAAFVKQGSPHRYGLTLFAGDSYLFCPVTADTAVLRQFIDAIDPGMVTTLGSNLEAGITTALERFDSSNSKSGRILVLSDGEDDELALSRVLDLIDTRGVRVDVLGLGTPEGKPIEIEAGTFLRDARGQVIHSRINEGSLRALADAGKGVFVRATLDDRDLDTLVKAGAPLVAGDKDARRRTITNYREIGPWLALAALLTIIVLARSSRYGALLRILLLVSLVPTTSHAQDSQGEPPSARKAYELYQNKRYNDAAAAFTSALRADPSNNDLKQGLASALFKGGRFSEALPLFSALADAAQDGRSFFDNEYNKANTLLQLKRYDEAIDAYNRALGVKPQDPQALHNRAIARALRDEAKRATPTPSPTPTPTSTPQQGPTMTPDPSKPTPTPTATGTIQATPTPAPTPSPDPANEPTPSPAATPTGAPSPTNSGDPTPQPSAQPSPGSTPTSDSASTPDPAMTPTPEATGSKEPHGAPTPSLSTQITPTPTSERLKEAQDDDPPVAPSPSTAGVALQPTPAEGSDLSGSEAHAWLESLPDSPLLIRRKRSEKRTGKQTW